MQTRCPHCRTLFEIQEAQLRAASGQARCSYCDNIFNAKKNLTQADPEERPVQETQQPRKNSGAISLNGLLEEMQTEERDLPDFDTVIELPDTGKSKKSQPVDAERKSSNSNSPYSFSEESKADGDPVDLQQKPPFAVIRETGISESGNPLAETCEPADVPIPQKRRQAAETRKTTGQYAIPESFIQTGRSHKARQRRHPLLWTAGILFLLTTALAQIVWFARGNLKGYTEVRELLELTCTRVGCELPPWHEPERFDIASRSVRTHPKNSSALQIQLVFNNTAHFAQAYPALQLKLYDSNEKLSAQRVFLPEEYLAEPHDKASLIKPAESVEVDMALADPGAGIIGFKIEFL